MADHYAWSDLYYGGETEERRAANGSIRHVVVNRDIIPHGEKVTKAKIGADDEQWEALIEGGSVRPYPVPEGVDEFTSPHRAVMRTLVDENGDIDINKLLEMGQPHPALVVTPPATNPPASAGKTVGDTPKGA